MTKADIQRVAMELPKNERLYLAEVLWQSIYDDSEPLPAWQMAILDERIAQADADPEGLEWAEVKRSVLESL